MHLSTIIIIGVLLCIITGVLVYLWKTKKLTKKRLAAIGAGLLVIGAGIPVILDLPGAPATWYVSPTGSDAAAGDIGNPFATIRKAINASSDEDIIYLRAGVHTNIRSSTTGILINRSGTSANWFTISGYPGETAIIDAVAYTSLGNNYGVFNCGQISGDESYIRISNLKIENVSGVSSCSAIRVWGYFGTLTGVTHHVRMDNITFNNIKYNVIKAWTEKSTYQPSNVTIENCTFNNTAWADGYMGEAVTFYNADRFFIKDNRFVTCEKSMIDCANGSRNGRICRNTFTNGTSSVRHAIYLDCSESSSPAAYVRNVSIYNNMIYGPFRGAICLGGENNGGLNNISVYNNIINSTSSSTSNYGISFEQSSADDNVYDNITIKYNTVSIRNEGYPLYFDGGYRTMMKTINITNNIFISSGGGDYQIRSSTLNSTDACLYIYNNVYNHTSKSPNTNWRDGTGKFEASAVQDDPEFVDRAGGNFHLNASSPAINAASATYTVSFDYENNARPQNTDYDIGAYEVTSGGGTSYETTIRTSGIDYFIWMGLNTTACYVKNNITGLDEATEYIAYWNNSGNWTYFYGDNTGNNHTFHTYDIVRTSMDDADSTITFYVDENPSIDYAAYAAARTVTLTLVNTGYNYTAYPRTGTTLSAINTTLTLPAGYVVGLWNETTYTWNYWISGFSIKNYAVSQYSVILTKIPSTKTWVQ